MVLKRLMWQGGRRPLSASSDFIGKLMAVQMKQDDEQEILDVESTGRWWLIGFLGMAVMPSGPGSQRLSKQGFYGWCECNSVVAEGLGPL